eukprot:5347460-Prymnesium_polylepis.1
MVSPSFIVMFFVPPRVEIPYRALVYLAARCRRRAEADVEGTLREVARESDQDGSLLVRAYEHPP